MKIFIGFSKPTDVSPFASLIEWVEARPYDHAYVRVPEPLSNEYVIFQAANLEVNLYNKNIFLQSHKSLKEYEVEITVDQYQALWKFIISMLGTPYSLKEDLGILLMKILWLKQQIFKDGLKAEFCSKLTAQTCLVLGMKFNQDPETIDPSLLDSDLDSLGLPCKENPNF